MNDLLVDVLAVSGVQGTVGASIEGGENWAVWWKDIPGAVLHAVTAGVVWVTLADHPPIQLMPGDVVLLPAGPDHILSTQPDALAHSCEAVADRQVRADGEFLRFGEGEVRVRMLSASYKHDPNVATQVLNLLPPVVHIRADNGGTCLGDTVRLLARELAHSDMGTSIVLNRLVDILLVQVLRIWLVSKSDQYKGCWLGVLGDPLIRSALNKIHQDPSRDWTTSTLAAEIGVSRATLSRRFPAIVGQTPGNYLTQWRMDLAALRLRESEEALENIAEAVGYTSVFAFSRAFTRIYKVPPGRYRQGSRHKN